MTPRKNADGSTSYEIRWRQGGTREGRNLSHTFGREKAAADALAAIVAAGYVCHCRKHVPEGVEPTHHFGAPAPRPATPADPTTFGAAADRHVELLTGIGPGYRRRYREEMARHFAPFRDRPLASITDEDVKAWIRGCEDGSHEWLARRVRGVEELVPTPLSPTTTHRLMVQASAIYRGAQSAGRVRADPFRDERGRIHRVGRRDRDQHAEMRTLTHDEYAVLAAALPTGLYRDLATVLVGTGLRWGEVTALTVGAVDLLATPPRLHVARAWQDDGAGGYQLGAPKSQRSRRTVTFSAAVLDALLPHVAGKSDAELVFATEHRGAPLRNSNFSHRVWIPALDRAQAAGLGTRPRIHDLRHTHVSWLIAAGVPVAAISRRLGHESITTTIDRYGHMLPQLDVDAIAALDAALPVRVD